MHEKCRHKEGNRQKPKDTDYEGKRITKQSNPVGGKQTTE